MSNPERFKIPYSYKLLMLAAIIIGPIYWLVFTEDGQRRTDIVVLTLAGEPSVEMRLDALTPDTTMDDFRKLYPDVEWKCKKHATAFGERYCGTRLAAFNDTPAYLLLLYFDGDRLSAMKVMYHSRYQDGLQAQLKRMLGAPQDDAGSPGVLQWETDHGLLLLPGHVDRAKNEEPALIWLSREKALKRAEVLQSE